MTYLQKITSRCILLLLFVSTLSHKVAAQSSTTKTAFDSTKVINEIDAQSGLFSNAFAKSDSVKAASIYTRDAKIFNHAIPTTTGRSGVQSLYGELIRAGITKFDYTTIGVWGNDNNLVVEEGTLSFAFSDGRVASKGRYLLVWKWEEGKLKIFRDSFSSDGKPKQ
ncbi:YybH family protein [Spirosoma validum]|uniref:Nuclear transport factor 2 family protein n=1 Tax=Spirosoma validum TaxID=2771355 RepID=A0A927GGS0_9BACT|nr:limonene-1,2-epoxide hydrolase family protein [Spirosoma validum]MBD2757282.1 nuclear transport factor 2 family protein [Spirosoma validum]